MREAVVALLMAGSLLVGAQPARAQIYEAVGTRAQGMGGAFVAVADDATTTWWNAAGIATGPYFSAVLQRTVIQEPKDVPSLGPARRDGATGVATTFPALGLSYYRFRISEIASPSPTTGGAATSREDRVGSLRLRSLSATQVGVTVGQSVGRHLVVASTLKLVRGASAAVVDEVAQGAAALDEAARLEAGGETRADLDVGVMASMGRLRLGASVRHVRQPSFGEGDSRFELARQGRVGLAVTGAGHGFIGAATAAVDADLTRTATAIGDVRHLAAGGEAWLFGKRVGIRGGVSVNTVGNARASGSGGVSLAIRSGLYVEGVLTGGSDESRKGWGAALRVQL